MVAFLFVGFLPLVKWDICGAIQSVYITISIGCQRILEIDTPFLPMQDLAGIRTKN